MVKIIIRLVAGIVFVCSLTLFIFISYSGDYVSIGLIPAITPKGEELFGDYQEHIFESSENTRPINVYKIFRSLKYKNLDTDEKDKLIRILILLAENQERTIEILEEKLEKQKHQEILDGEFHHDGEAIPYENKETLFYGIDLKDIQDYFDNIRSETTKFKPEKIGGGDPQLIISYDNPPEKNKSIEQLALITAILSFITIILTFTKDLIAYFKK